MVWNEFAMACCGLEIFATHSSGFVVDLAVVCSEFGVVCCEC